jgi:hypothetical protein
MTLTSSTPQSQLGSDESDEHLLPPTNPSPCPSLQLQNKPLISDKSIERDWLFIHEGP